jgi:hypothetical protein
MMWTNPQAPVQRGAAVAAMAIAALCGVCGCRPRSTRPPEDFTSAAFLNARLRGAIDADLVWKGSELASEGGARPDGRGIRVALAGPLGADGRRLRLVFGMAARPGQADARAVPTNVTLIVEGANQLYATLGEDKCSVDALRQQPVTSGDGVQAPDGGGEYWVSARGFCVAPAATLDGTARVLLNRFDFRGRIRLEASDLHAAANPA